MNPPPGDDAGGAGELAEQALLGALLWEPARVADINDWLAADDFYRPAHAAIYRTITGLWTMVRRRRRHATRWESPSSAPVTAGGLHR